MTPPLPTFRCEASNIHWASEEDVEWPQFANPQVWPVNEPVQLFSDNPGVGGISSCHKTQSWNSESHGRHGHSVQQFKVNGDAASTGFRAGHAKVSVLNYANVMLGFGCFLPSHLKIGWWLRLFMKEVGQLFSWAGKRAEIHTGTGRLCKQDRNSSISINRDSMSRLASIPD